LERLQRQLDAGKPLRTMRWSDAEEKEMAPHFGFLSRRPLLVVVNAPEKRRRASLLRRRGGGGRGGRAISLCAPWRRRSRELILRAARLPPGDGLSEPARARFIRAAYKLLAGSASSRSARTR